MDKSIKCYLAYIWLNENIQYDYMLITPAFCNLND